MLSRASLTRERCRWPPVPSLCSSLLTRPPLVSGALDVLQQVVAEGMGVNDERVLQQAQDELSELLRRNRRSCAAAQRALLPPELHYIVR